MTKMTLIDEFRKWYKGGEILNAFESDDTVTALVERKGEFSYGIVIYKKIADNPTTKKFKIEDACFGNYLPDLMNDYLRLRDN